MENFKQFIAESVDINTIHEILGMYNDQQRYSLSDITNLTGIPKASIYRILKQNSINPHRRHTNYESVYTYADSGFKPKQISELSGYSLRQIYNILGKRNNIF